MAGQINISEATRLVTDRELELTGFQEAAAFKPVCDFRNDFVMVYGTGDDRPDYIKSWVEKGYVPHFMTGIAWGGYQDFKDLNGNNIMSLAQTRADGTQWLHGKMTPYIVPSVEFADYICDKLEPIIDSGVKAIYLEEPEFWANAGFSDAFKREWRLFYDEPYERPGSSVDAQYKTNRLKYYLYQRAIRRVAEKSKEYALHKYGRELKIYVPTHSLINYTQWGIVSPQSSLIDSNVVDGCIAQIWTGTARTPNVYQGRLAERTFETAFLEYGVMQELVRGTGRKMWFLHDPIEDNPKHDWQDYRFNYKETLIASLLHPHIWRYEICPWPSRILTRKYPSNSQNASYIPDDYLTTLCIVFNQLRDMNQQEITWTNATKGIGVFIADSSMFQRAEPAESLAQINEKDPSKAGRKDIEHFSGFYGLTVPLVKLGIPVMPVQLDNAARFAGYLNDYKVLVLSYEFFKPQNPALNQAVAQWVANGGSLVYVGGDTDPFNQVSSWWNSGENSYKAPSQHLMQQLGLDKDAPTGEYEYGKGTVFIERCHPAHFTHSAAAGEKYINIIKPACKAAGLEWHENNFIQLRRGPYIIAACLDESVSDKPLELEGLFVDIFHHELPVLERVKIKPGSHSWLFDINKIKKDKAEPIASAARFESWEQSGSNVIFKLSCPENAKIVTRIYLPAKPVKMSIDDMAFSDYKWDEKSSTLFFESPDKPRQSIEINW
ncbi:hypothetical protein [Limihaloglobus sulfuriphilus]|nr:hypothetical protein [Limihaloglobus sulfuriphilus]